MKYSSFILRNCSSVFCKTKKGATVNLPPPQCLICLLTPNIVYCGWRMCWRCSVIRSFNIILVSPTYSLKPPNRYYLNFKKVEKSKLSFRIVLYTKIITYIYVNFSVNNYAQYSFLQIVQPKRFLVVNLTKNASVCRDSTK